MFVLVALISIAANLLLYRKVLSQRVHVRVNDTAVSKRMLYDWMEERYGLETTMRIITYELLTQGAAKAGVKPDPKEIDEEMRTIRETRPDTAMEWKLKPWTEEDARKDIETKLALRNLQAKGVPATDAQIQKFFDDDPDPWDKPVRVYTHALVTKSPQVAERAKDIMEQVGDMTVVAQELGQDAQLMGADGTWVFQHPPDFPPPSSEAATVEAMKDHEVRVLRLSHSQFLVIRRERKEPGREVDLREVKDRVATAYKAAHGPTERHILWKLWEGSSIQTEDPTLKQQIEYMLFPDAWEALKG